MQRFQDRHDAGRRLAAKLSKYANRPDVIVLALPRGGLPVAYEVAQALHAPLDILIVRKLGMPGQEELAIGAIASGGIRILNQDIIDSLGLSPGIIEHVIERERLELERREQTYREGRPAPDIREHTVILVDDGLATGASMLAAVRAVHTQNPVVIAIAVPTTSIQAIQILQQEADEVIVVMSPEPFEGVGKWYTDFTQTTDQEVQLLLEEANRQFQNK